jgi:putative DNA methylase
MSHENVYPKRLIEVDLPIRRISAHARRENGVRHGHFKTLHMWWARRPLAACRAVICASLWPDPCDSDCPSAFVSKAATLMLAWAGEQMGLHTPDSVAVFRSVREQGSAESLSQSPELLRSALLEFVADLADWDRSGHPEFLATARNLNQAAHEALGGLPGTHPRIFDPFAGGGSIPLEALRMGGEACASDLNPVAVLLNRMVLEQIPRHGPRLADSVREVGERIRKRAVEELSPYYPRDPDGATPIAYIWARTVLSEGPDAFGDGIPVEIPLVRGFWLAKKAGRNQALRWRCDSSGQVVTEVVTLTYADGRTLKVRRPLLEIFRPKSAGELPASSVQRGSATCPVTGHTTPVARVRAQLKTRRGGGDDARILAVATLHPAQSGRNYRLATAADEDVLAAARTEAQRRREQRVNGVAEVPDEPLDVRGIRHTTWAMIYGLNAWGDLFTSRQLIALTTLRRLIAEECAPLAATESPDFAQAVRTALAFALSKQADLANALCPWEPGAECPRHLFSRQAVPFVWDFAEGIPIGESNGSWSICVDRTADTIPTVVFSTVSEGQAMQCSATAHWLPDDSAQLFFTDPPYYDAVPYAYLSDFFYVWLRRCLAGTGAALDKLEVVPKEEEIVVDRPHELSESHKDIAFYERELCRAFAEARRVLAPDGIGAIVFASKTTASWEAIIKAVIEAGWIITASWPIDTEMVTRVSAQGQARLASSVHLICRPREDEHGQVPETNGQWRDVLDALPKRIAAWLPRLAAEGVVGADAIFACLGPALEIFSRYSSVEKASGEKVELREYLEQVWAEVARQALNMIFEGGDASGLEEDGRLTAMWLWTLRTDAGADDAGESDDEADAGDEDAPKKAKPLTGYALEYDAARKIAQGLGCHLENLGNLVEVKGETATLLSAGARARYLFGRDDVDVPKKRGKKKGADQGDLFAALALPSDDELEREQAELDRPPAGKTVLDQLHQSMILFGVGRGQALKRFLVDDGIGANPQYWKLAQAFSALYPPQSEEKRWVDGVLARKKGLGF